MKVDIPSPLNIPDSIYERLFKHDGDGVSVLKELAVLFYDRKSYVQGDPHHTSFNEGARSVVSYLISRAGYMPIGPE